MKNIHLCIAVAPVTLVLGAYGSAPAQVEEGLLMSPGIVKGGYKLRPAERQPGSAKLLFAHDHTHGILRVSYGERYRGFVEEWSFRENAMTSSGKGVSFVMRSGFPLGDDAYRNTDTDNRSHVSAILGTEVFGSALDVRHLCRKMTEEELDLVEGCVRWAMAQVVGARTRPADDATVGNGSARCRQTPGGLRLVDLEGWADAQGVLLTVNETLGTCAFTRNGRLTVVPLGAKGFKSGSNWWSYGVPNCAVDGRWFVPLDALEART
jgi:hypothetical protein